MSNLLQEIEAQISGLKTSVTKQNVGTVRESGDGVAKIEGLTDCMYNEMIDFGDGVMGLALNLEETEVWSLSGNGGTISGTDFFVDILTTSLAEDEIVTAGRGRADPRPGRASAAGNRPSRCHRASRRAG